MRRLIAAAALLAAAMLAIAATASADVPRYQTGTLTVTLTDYGYTHVYNITTCGTSFTGTGGIADLALRETIAGTYDGTNLHFRADYLTYNVGYHYTESMYAITWKVTGLTSFKNHGDFVSQATDKQAAAQSLVGMPCG